MQKLTVMNYQRIYNNLINKRISSTPEGYVERHHIIPKSIGGSNDSDNLVALTAREHFIAHLLLSKMFPENSISWIKMQKALLRMFSVSINQHRYSPSKWYSYCREQVSRANKLNQLGEGNSQFGKVWMYNPILKQSKSIKREEVQNYLSTGWSIGRVLKWDKRALKQSKKLYKSPEQIEELKHKQERKQLERAKKIELYTQYYKLYNELGWSKFVSITGYDKSKPNLVAQFKRYIDDFVPQNGKKRGK